MTTATVSRTERRQANRLAAAQERIHEAREKLAEDSKSEGYVTFWSQRLNNAGAELIALGGAVEDAVEAVQPQPAKPFLQVGLKIDQHTLDRALEALKCTVPKASGIAALQNRIEMHMVNDRAHGTARMFAYGYNLQMAGRANVDAYGHTQGMASATMPYSTIRDLVANLPDGLIFAGLRNGECRVVAGRSQSILYTRESDEFPPASKLFATRDDVEPVALCPTALRAKVKAADKADERDKTTKAIHPNTIRLGDASLFTHCVGPMALAIRKHHNAIGAKKAMVTMHLGPTLAVFTSLDGNLQYALHHEGGTA